MMDTGDTSDMTREDRKERTLRVLSKSGLAVPIAVLARNIKLQGGTFEESSVRRYLNEMLEEGHVIKVDPIALDDGEIVEVGKSDEGYWMASQMGRDRIKSDDTE